MAMNFSNYEAMLESITEFYKDLRENHFAHEEGKYGETEYLDQNEIIGNMFPYRDMRPLYGREGI